jgi:hypothetical protein
MPECTNRGNLATTTIFISVPIGELRTLKFNLNIFLLFISFPTVYIAGSLYSDVVLFSPSNLTRLSPLSVIMHGNIFRRYLTIKWHGILR